MNLGFSEKILQCLQGKVEAHNEKYPNPVTIHQLIRVYKRGEQATDSAWSPSITMAQAAMARVNMFLRFAAFRSVKDSYAAEDQDILKGSDRTYEQEMSEPFWDFEDLDYISARCDLLLVHLTDCDGDKIFIPPQVEEG
tara:strand:- start:507 stop:923 length:417 start_codon:yes stop_codon:yes gene_type:complete